MKKIKINSEVCFYLGLIVLAFGVQFLIIADFGMPIVQACCYILSEKISWLSFGMANYFIHVLLLGVLAISTKKITLKYIISFINAFIYGLIIDGVEYLLRNVTAATIAGRIVFFFFGFWFVVLAVILFFRTNIPLLPYDMFVKDLSVYKKWEMSRFKIVFDISWIFFVPPLSYLCFGKLVGIGWGTIISAIFIAVSVSLTIKYFDKVFVLVPKFKNLFKMETDNKNTNAIKAEDEPKQKRTETPDKK